MAYEIQTIDGDTIFVDANSGERDNTFIVFFKRGEPVTELRNEQRGVWPFRRTETVERDITSNIWVVSIRTDTVAQMKPVSDDELAAAGKLLATT